MWAAAPRCGEARAPRVLCKGGLWSLNNGGSVEPEQWELQQKQLILPEQRSRQALHKELKGRLVLPTVGSSPIVRGEEIGSESLSDLTNQDYLLKSKI